MPLLTMFADFWSHESDTGLPAPTVSQLAVCLARCSRSLESANTAEGTFVVNPDTNTVVNRINITMLNYNDSYYSLELTVYLAWVC